MSCLSRAVSDGWSDRSIDEDFKFELDSLVEIRVPPTAPNGKRIQINANHSDVYEAAIWCRARVRASEHSESGAVNSLSEAEFELLFPEHLTFQTYIDSSNPNPVSTMPSSQSLETDDEVPAPRQLSFSHQTAQSAPHRPFSVNWHLNGPRRVAPITTRNVRSLKFADPIDQPYIKDQPIEVFMTNGTRGSQTDCGIWCLGFIRENSSPESPIIQVHVFGGLNDHALRSSTGEEINGPNVFGYNIDIPRFSTSPSRLPIRAIRYVGVDSDGSVCRFGARQSAISSIEEQSSVLVSETQKLIPNESSDKSLSLEFEAVPPKPAPLWAQVLAILLLLSALCGVIVAMYAGFPSMKKVYAEIFGVVVAACIILTILALLLVATQMDSATEAVAFMFDSTSSSSQSTQPVDPFCTPTKLVLLCPILLIAAAFAWALILSPLWLISYLVEGLGGWPWWVSMLFDLLYLAAAIFLVFLFNENIVRREVLKADEIDAHPLADFWAARQLEDLRKMTTPVA